MPHPGSRPRPLDYFFAHIGWDEFILNHEDFPLVNWSCGVRQGDWKLGVTCTDKRTGEIVTLWDDEGTFPTDVLVDSFKLLCGDISGIMTDHQKMLNRRQDRGRGRYRRR